MMKHFLITTIAAVVLVVGCGESQPTEPPTAKAPDISIHGAARTGNIEAVKEAIAAGADVNAMDKVSVLWKDYIPLHLAAAEEHKEIAELLIANGADVNAKDGGGWTPLHWAAARGQTEVAELLRKHGGKTGEELKAEGK